MKAYTDLEQSKKLAEILPIESADMHYNNASIKGMNYVDEHRAELMDYITAKTVLSKYMINPLFEVIPCWSLAALLKILDFPLMTQEKKQNKLEFCLLYYNNYEYIEITEANPVDACYEMILKLHEQKLLRLWNGYLK